MLPLTTCRIYHYCLFLKLVCSINKLYIHFLQLDLCRYVYWREKCFVKLNRFSIQVVRFWDPKSGCNMSQWYWETIFPRTISKWIGPLQEWFGIQSLPVHLAYVLSKPLDFLLRHFSKTVVHLRHLNYLYRLKILMASKIRKYVST